MTRLRRVRDIRRHLLQESGQSLVLALIVLVVLTISAGAVAQLMLSNQNVSNYERQGVQAFTGGEAGLDVAANAVVSYDSSTPSIRAVGSTQSGSTTVAGNHILWTATKTGASQWTIASTTTSPNGKVVRRLQEQMQSVTHPGQPPTISGYGLVMGGNAAPTTTGAAICNATQPPTTTSFGGSAAITVRTWITTDVCIKGGASPAIGNPSSGAPITVHIGGALAVSGPDYAIGAPTNKVASASINNGCWAAPHSGWTLLGGCDLNQNLTANSSPTAGSGVQALDYHPTEPVPTPTKQTIDDAAETQEWLNASPGPKHPCTTGSAPANLFDNNASSTTGPDTSINNGALTELTTLLGSSAFDCATSSGEIKWTPSGSGGTLFVSGGIFIDANLQLTGGNSLIKLAPDSNGSIYVDGYVTMQNSASICAYISSGACTPASDAWDPNTNPHDPLVYIAAFNRSHHVPGLEMAGNSALEAIAYTNGNFFLGNSAKFGGSVTADYGTLNGNGRFIVTNVAPNDSFGSQTTTTSWAVAPRTWRQCPVTTGCS